MEKRQYGFATWLRAFAAILILLCHYVQQSENVYLRMSSQFFNIGVEIFFILSGFLFGVQSAGGGVLQAGLWYKKRIKRIYIPYEMFVIVLAVIYFISGLDFSIFKWVRLVLGLQGASPGLSGANQTWFITALLVCYLVTPALSRVAAWLECNKKYVPATAAVICVVPFLLAWVPPEFVTTLLSPVVWYTLAYMLGRRFNQVSLSKKRASIAFIAMCTAFGTRFIARFILDGTIWYDRIIAKYTHAFAAFCIFYLFAWLFEQKASPKAVRIFSEISFEVYLYHAMFCVGPLKLFGSTPFWVTDCLLVTAVTVLIAVIMHWLSEKITSSLSVK